MLAQSTEKMQRQFHVMFREVVQANKRIQVEFQTKWRPNGSDYLLASGYEYTRSKDRKVVALS